MNQTRKKKIITNWHRIKTNIFYAIRWISKLFLFVFLIIISIFLHNYLFTVDFSNLYSNYYQPTLFNTSPQATTNPTLYDHANQPQYNNCYVLDDESSGEMHNGGKSADYVVDHADDYDLGQASPAAGLDDVSGQRKRAYSGGKDAAYGGANKVIRQQTGATSVHDAQQMSVGAQGVKTEKDLGYGKGKLPPQQSLLKGPATPATNKKVIKQEKDSFSKYEMSVPDITINAPAQVSSSPSSSTGSGKSFYSKDDLFTDEVPNELFGEDANTVSVYLISFPNH